MKFAIIKSCLALFSGIFAVGTPSNIHGTAISYRCAKFGAFVNSVTILTLRDLTRLTERTYVRTYVRVYRLYGWGRGDYQKDGRGVSDVSWQVHIFKVAEHSFAGGQRRLT